MVYKIVWKKKNTKKWREGAIVKTKAEENEHIRVLKKNEMVAKAIRRIK